MNEKRRDEIERIIDALTSLTIYVEEFLDDEKDCLDNMSKDLQSREKVEIVKNAISVLEEDLFNICDCIDKILSVLG